MTVLAIDMLRNTRKDRSATVDNLISHGTVVVKMLREMAEATNIPYLKPISGISLLIFDTVQTVKTNQEECVKMTERTYEIICAIINVCQDSNADLSPAMVRNVGNFSATLGKILSYLRQQVDGSLIKRLVRHVENSSLLSECNDGLKHAHNVFMVQSSIATSVALAQSRKDANERHRELLAAISTHGQSGKLSNLGQSSSSLLMIPASPKIFHGRESELELVNTALLHSDPARIAILGIGGIGKSTLALAALHSPEVDSKFSTRQYFISCESATSPSMLMNIIAAYFGSKDSEEEKPIQAIKRYFLSHPDLPSVLVLDNFETPWEPLESRAQVEEILSLLSEVHHLDIIVTMRGAERPGNTKWTRPFLPPLNPITSQAAREIFYDISDPLDEETQVNELLKFTDNLPLAVTLIAHLASFEGCDSVFRRWKTESTSMLSDGLDKRSNLDKSIMLSLTSPRMTATPGSLELLSLLSLLPDGISEANLERAGVPLSSVSRCRATLCRTSLAFIDRDHRLKALVPIRQFIKRSFPPSSTLIRPLRNLMYDLLKPFETWELSPVGGIFQRVNEDIGNIHSLIDHALDMNKQDIDTMQTIHCIINLSTFNYLSVRDVTSLYLLISLEPTVESFKDDPNLRGRYFLALVRAGSLEHIPGINDIDEWAQKALLCFSEVNDTAGQAETYTRLSWYYVGAVGSPSKALKTCRRALQLSKQAGSLHLQSIALSHLSFIERRQGHLQGALAAAYDALSSAQNSGNLYDQVRALMRVSDCHIDIGRNFCKAYNTNYEAMTLLEALGMDSTCDFHQALLGARAEIHLLKTEYDDARKLHVMNLGGFDLADSEGTGKTLGHAQAHYPLNALLNVTSIDVVTGGGDLSGDVIHARLDTIRPLVAQYSILTPFCDVIQAELYMRQKHYNLAQNVLERNLMIIWNDLDGAPEILLLCYEGLFNTTRAKEESDQSLRYAVLFLAEGLRAQSWLSIHRALRFLGDVLWSEGDETTAETLFLVALEGSTFMDIHRDRAVCMLRLGDIWRKRDVAKAAQYWREARPLFERSSQSLDVAQCDERLATYECMKGCRIGMA